MLRVKRKGNGDYVVSMPVPALICLQGVPDRLRKRLENPDFSDKVVQRLFPIAYKDKAKEAEYRKLVREDLQREKLENLRTFEEIIAGSKLSFVRANFTVPKAKFETLLCLINDMRLVLGTELGIEEDDWQRDIPEDDPQAESYFLLHFLSLLEETLLRATD